MLAAASGCATALCREAKTLIGNTYTRQEVAGTDVTSQVTITVSCRKLVKARPAVQTLTEYSG